MDKYSKNFISWQFTVTSLHLIPWPIAQEDWEVATPYLSGYRFRSRVFAAVTIQFQGAHHRTPRKHISAVGRLIKTGRQITTSPVPGLVPAILP